MSNHGGLLPLFKHGRYKGLSLIELITAISIIAILSVVAIPLFTSLINNYRLSATANQLYYHLELARTEAQKRNARVYVSFSTGDTWCYGINPVSACNCTIPNNCSLATASYGKAEQISLSTSGVSSSFYFEGTHGAASTSGTATFTQYGQSSPLITLSIGRLGNITMCSTGIGGYTAC